VDFTYKRENDDLQRNNLLNALEVIETLKDSVKKADKNSNKNNILSSEIKPKKYIDDINDDIKSNDNTNNSNNKSGNQMILNNKIYYMNTENTGTINQTYDNQVLFTDKNNYNEKDISSGNLFTVRKENIEKSNNTKNKNYLQNMTSENGSKLK
jgi:hypothetical protein